MMNFVCITFVCLSTLSRAENIYSHTPFDAKPKRFRKPEVQNVYTDLSLIQKFVFKFTKVVLSSPELSGIYLTSLPPEKAQEAYNKIVFVAVDNVHTQYPRDVAHIVSSAIRVTFSNLTLTQHVQSYGYAAATLMVSKDILRYENLRKMCNSYVFFVKQAVCTVPNVTDPGECFIQAVFDGLVHFMTSLNLFTAETVLPLAEGFSESLHCLTGVPVPPPVDPCCEDNLIEKFVSKYSREILASPRLSEIFVTSLLPEVAEETYYRIVYNTVANVHAYSPKAVSRIYSNAIQQTYGNLSLSQHVKAVGYAAARFLTSRNALTCDNLNELCDAYILYIKQEVRNVPKISERRYTYLQAIVNSFVYFMISLDLFTEDTVVPLATICADALYYVTGIGKNPV